MVISLRLSGINDSVVGDGRTDGIVGVGVSTTVVAVFDSCNCGIVLEVSEGVGSGKAILGKNGHKENEASNKTGIKILIIFMVTLLTVKELMSLYIKLMEIQDVHFVSRLKF